MIISISIIMYDINKRDNDVYIQFHTVTRCPPRYRFTGLHKHRCGNILSHSPIAVSRLSYSASHVCSDGSSIVGLCLSVVKRTMAITSVFSILLWGDYLDHHSARWWFSYCICTVPFANASCMRPASRRVGQESQDHSMRHHWVKSLE